MSVDLVELLRELGFTIATGTSSRTWKLRSPDGDTFEVEPMPATERITSHYARNAIVHSSHHSRRLLVGRSSTPGVLRTASSGQVDILIEDPLQLIIQGRRFMVNELPEIQARRPAVLKRPAWTRWAVERCILLAASSLRQSEIADLLLTSQQSVSLTAQHLRGLVDDFGTGVTAIDKAKLLHHWAEEYPGPNGQEFGWYSLSPIVDQTLQAAETAHRLGAGPIISGDVAADRLAPWKLPSRGRIYLNNPVDLAEHGFIAAPVKEASLITCVPRDPTLWRLTEMGPRASTARIDLADAAIVYWDVLYGGDVDSNEAAHHLAELILEASHA